MVFCIAWNPASGTNGEPALLASCGVDKTLRLWTQNPQTSAFECSRTFEGAHAGTGRFFSWSPEGRFLAIPSYDGTTYIWDKNEDEVHDMEDLDLEEDDKEEVLSVSWDHSGCYLATCSRAAVRIWETLLLPRCESDKLADSEDAIMVQFHPSEDLLFSCCRDDTIEIWAKYDFQEWYMAQTLDHETKAHSSKGFSISFNATGDKMVTSREDLSIKVWGPEGKLSGDSGREYVSWAHIYTLRGHHERPIFSVHWSSEGIIATGAADGAIRLFVENQDGLERGRDMFKLLLVKEKAHEVDIMQWGSKSQATGEAKFEMQMTKKRAHEMDGNSALQVPKLQERQNDMLKHLVPNEKVSAVHWGPKGINLLASSSEKGTIKIWQLTTLQ